MKGCFDLQVAILFIVQIIIIAVIAKSFGWFSKKCKQPSVIGEMLAGIVLGPTVFGFFLPELFLELFPEESLPTLNYLSQIGLVLFLFIIGMELNIASLKNKAKDAIIISQVSIICSFIVGFALAYYLYPRFGNSAEVDFISFALFIAVSMSITAFPVLASIIKERNMQTTKIGSLGLVCAAADDFTAWILLAFIIAIVKATSMFQVILTVCLSAVYILAMLKLVKPILRNISNKYSNLDRLPNKIMLLYFVVLIVAAIISAYIGIHALFGAFLSGVIIPANILQKNYFIKKFEGFTKLILLPLFFVCTGLRTNINFGLDVALWSIALLILFLAIVSKLFSAALATKLLGYNWKDSLTIGALMNTKGLMELVVLNIGLDLGVISLEIFSMLVFMVIITTCMTGPLLLLIDTYKQNTNKK